MADENNVTLTESENAFFSSGGETPIVEAAPEVVETVTTEKPETVDQTQAEKDRDEKGRFVPHQALHAEREEHKKTRSELQTIRERQAILEDRWNTLLKASEPEKVDTPPDPNVDIFAALAYERQKREQIEGKLSERDQQDKATRDAQEQDNAIWGHWQASRAEYAATKPDFDDAASFLADQRDKQLGAYGILDGKYQTKQARDQQINAELKQIILAAGQKGINPADAVYQIAQQYGYAGKAAETVTDPGKMELSEKLGNVATAIEKSKTLGQAQSRSSGGDALSAQAIADMPAHEFEAWMKTPDNARRFKTLMGG